MKLARRKFLYLAAGAVALPAGSRVASAQAYPTRPITMTVPGDAGGPADTVGRVLAERMRASLGQPIIIENVTGAEGNIATTRATRAKPDGYTIDLGLQAISLPLSGGSRSKQPPASCRLASRPFGQREPTFCQNWNSLAIASTNRQKSVPRHADAAA
jgi:tripartite-type tricarboxylate transporter receptor subunit TctC